MKSFKSRVFLFGVIALLMLFVFKRYGVMGFFNNLNSNELSSFDIDAQRKKNNDKNNNKDNNNKNRNRYKAHISKGSSRDTAKKAVLKTFRRGIANQARSKNIKDNNKNKLKEDLEFFEGGHVVRQGKTLINLESLANAVPDFFSKNKKIINQLMAIRNKPDLTLEDLNEVKRIQSKLIFTKGVEFATFIDSTCIDKKTNTVKSSFYNQMSAKKFVANKNKNVSKLPIQAYSVEINKDVSLPNLVKNVNKDPCVNHVTENVRVSLTNLLNDPQLKTIGQELLIKYINNEDVYALTMNSDKPITQDTVIAIVDDGVDFDHPDLKKSIHSKNFDIVQLKSSYKKGGRADPNDDHGTKGAGAAAAIANNGVGIVGAFGYKTKIMSIRVWFNNKGYVVDINNGIMIATENGAHVINVSFSGSLTSYEFTAAEAVKKGAFVTMSAGNGKRVGNKFIGQKLSGGTGVRHKGVVLVGSTKRYKKSGFSDYGPAVEIAAPGEDITSTTKNSGYSEVRGTSFSSPVVAGVVAAGYGILNSHGIKPNPKELEDLLILGAKKDTKEKGYFKDNAHLDAYGFIQALYDKYPQTRPKPVVKQISNLTPNIDIGSKLELSIDVAHGETYQWYRNGELIPGANSVKHTIEKIKWGERGTYHVLIKNKAGETKSQGTDVGINSVSRSPSSENNLRSIGVYNRMNWRQRVIRDPGFIHSNENKIQ